MSVESPTTNFQALRDGATRVRLAALRMIAPHGQGYLGQALGTAEILSVLYDAVLHGGATTPTSQRDKIVISPGHYIVGAYAALAIRGELSDSELAAYGNDGSRLEAVGTEHSPGVDYTCGSLGQGLSVAIGFATSAQLRTSGYRTYVLCSDGEMEEGQLWEAAMFAAHRRLDKLRVVVDCNNSQVDGAIDEITTIEPIADKWRAFGWDAREVNGHDVEALYDALALDEPHQSRPRVVLARTNIWQGLTSLAGTRDAHFIKLTPQDAVSAERELAGQIG
jgi:transketolase